MPDRPRILNVDDDAATRYIRTRILTQAGFDVAEAATGAETLRLAGGQPPAVVLLDLKLPDIDGFEVCRRLKQTPETARIQVLHISAAFRTPQDRAAGLNCGADGFLTEPVEPEVLVATVRALLRIRQATAELELEIGRRKEAEAALTAEKHRLEQVFRSIPAYVVSYSGPEHVVEFINAPSQALWGGRNPVGKPLREAFPEIGEALMAKWDTVYRTGIPFHSPEMPARIDRGGGRLEERFIDLSLIPRLDADGRVTGVLAYGTDQTERVRNRRLAEEGRRMLDALMEHVPEGITIADAPDVKIRVVSKHGRQLTGRPPEAIEGIPVQEHPERWGLLRPDGTRPAPEDLPLSRAVLRGEVVIDEEWVLERPAGDAITILCNAGPIRDARGTITGGVIAWRDITSRKALEHRLFEAQKLESLEVLAGGVAHDYNNLLTGIMGNAGLLQQFIPSGSTEAGILEGILKASERAAHLTQQMLAYSGRGQFMVRQLAVGPLIAETAGLVSHALSKKVKMSIRIPDGLPQVEADSSQLQQVITNLLLNAAEAMGDHPGEIGVTASLQKLDAGWAKRRGFYVHTGTELREGDHLAIEIKDSGCGMDGGTMAKIFDPFFTTKFPGRGLGLPAALGVVRALQGAIAVRSAPARGTTFIVLLPVGRRPVPEKDRKESPEDLTGTETVLVVDDEQLVRDLARPALERYGYKVLLAEDGPSGIETYARNAARIDAVVLDLSMPGLDGREVLARLEELNPELPVVVMSGYDGAVLARQFAGTGAAGFLQKPFKAHQIARALRAALSRKRG
jgi:two-component system, cell cycle sensor histidine kinase and response regulator CckA